MANRIFIIPRRNDLEGMNVQLTDLSPNTSQRNSIQDGEGQTHYIGSCPDTPGATVVSGAAYVRGSKSTSLADDPVELSTTGAGNDCFAPETTTLGLAAYIRDRVQDAATTSFWSVADANTAAAGIRTIAEAGDVLDETAITAALAAVVAGSDLTAAPSFGTVEDILRILSGETYISPQYTIITDTAGPTFLNEADRDTLVAAQLSSVTGLTFVSKGHFLTSLENGFVGRPTIAKTGIVLASIGAGQMSHLADATTVVLNPAFTYGAGTAVDIAGNAIPATGVHPVAHVYTHTGSNML